VGGVICGTGGTSVAAAVTSSAAVVTSGPVISGAVARNCLVATAFLAAASRRLVRAAFLPPALTFRVFAALVAISLPPGRDLIVVMAFRAAAFRFLVSAAFLPAALSFRVRAAFRAAKLCFVAWVFLSCRVRVGCPLAKTCAVDARIIPNRIAFKRCGTPRRNRWLLVWR
jgi:hypothetical protein